MSQQASANGTLANTPAVPIQTGLTNPEVLALRQQFGENRLPAEKAVSTWKILLSQLKSPLVYIILFAALVSLALGEYGDFGIIIAVVVIDVILGLIQEYQAQQTYLSLKGLLKPTTTVLRNGERTEIELWELVPGDLAILNAGEHVPGDGHMLEVTMLAVDEAILTGESEPVTKGNGAGDGQVYMGTTVVTGRGLLLVEQTGIRTELGKIAASLQGKAEEQTPLQVRLQAFSKILTYIVLGFTIAILLVGLAMGGSFLVMLRTAIILAIAAVPEGLLIAVTVILVLGMRKILARDGLVKRLLAVETLGSVTTICTDKTGTLTEGRMRVSRTDLIDQTRAWQTMVLCNNLEGPVDIALWEHAEKLGLGSPQELFHSSQRIGEQLFTSETKYMLTDVKSRQFNGQHIFFLKGAPEIVLAMCELPADDHQRLLQQVDAWAADGLRLLGLACRQDGRLEDYTGYTWLGLLGMEDPVRAGVKEAIETARHAGIRVKMITGDYLRTAEHIARAIGLATPGGTALEGTQIQAMDDEQLRQVVTQTDIFARIRPQDKYRVIRALHANGEVTAMIGDGVNDAPALKHADIGVVVGAATDVAKETADLILLDNNFKTIIAAVEEGRTIFENIRKVVAYTLSNSFAEVLTIFVSMLLGWPAPLLVAQILWIHLICDGPSDIVLGFEPKEEGIMDEPPKSLREPVLTRLGGTMIILISVVSAAVALALFGYHHLEALDPVKGRSLVFASFAINSQIYIFAYRSMRRLIFQSGPLSRNKPLVYTVLFGWLMAVIPFMVPGLRSLLGLTVLTFADWVLVVVIALGLLLIVEAGKWFAMRWSKPEKV